MVDVASSLAKEDRVCSLVHLGRVLAGELRSDERGHVLRARVAELVAVAFCWLGRPFRTGLDVVNGVDLVHEEAFGLHDDSDCLQRSHVFQTHRHGAGNGLTDHEIDLGLPRKQSQHLTDLIALKFAHTHAAALGCTLRFGRGGCRLSSRRRRGRWPSRLYEHQGRVVVSFCRWICGLNRGRRACSCSRLGRARLCLR
jgi:hypothetical protein